MDIPALSTAMSMSQVQYDFGVAMLSKSLDLTQQIGNGIVELMDSSSMENSVTPYIGGNIDISV